MIFNDTELEGYGKIKSVPSYIAWFQVHIQYQLTYELNIQSKNHHANINIIT